MTDFEWKAGNRVRFAEERNSYVIWATDGQRWAICTKPFALMNTVIYCIVDFKKGVRGRNNLIFNCYDYATDEGVAESLKDLQSGEIEVSRRSEIPVVLADKQPKKRKMK